MPRAAVPSALLLAAAFAAPVMAQDTLEASFRRPPAEARPHTWWHWMNGNVSRAGITADLEAMKRVGLGGAQIFNVSEGIPLGPVAYNSDQWRELVRFAASEAKRLGLELCIHNCAGWSSSGGPWVTPERAMQRLTIGETRVAGGARASKLAQPETNGGYYRDVAVLAFPTPRDDTFRIENVRAKALFDSQYGLQPASGAVPDGAAIPMASVVELSGKLGADGALDWTAPAGGEWTVLRIGHTLTGAMNAPSPDSGRGLEVDKLSAEAFDAFWAGGMAPLLDKLGPLGGQVLNNCLVDSYEMGCQNWTPKLREEFRARRGYDPVPYLAVVTGRVVGSAAASERFLWDFRRTIGDLYTDNYYSRFATRCKERGLLSSVEPYDGPFECQQVARDADIVMGEFWADGGMNGSCKLAASVGHVYAKKFIGAESFTAFPGVGKWTNTPASLKGVGDLMYTAGINRYIIHRYAHQPWTGVEPGMTMGQWGTHFERTTTWWEQGAAWLAYLARCQSLLQQGTFVADVLYFVGESSPNGYALRPELKAAGYDYDMCGTDVLLERASVKGNRIVLPSGMSYRVLVLPDTPYMTPRLARKVRDMVKDGATVIGPRPTASPSNAGGEGADREVAAIGAEVWGDCDGVKVTRHNYGAGSVFCGRSPEDVLKDTNVVPDCVVLPADAAGPRPKATWIHRTIAGAEVYFVSNQKPRSEEVAIMFRVSGKAPELWHPETGETGPTPVWSSASGDQTMVPLRLEAWGSAFVVFRGEAKGDHLVGLAAPQSPDAPRAPALAIVKATYDAVDGAGGADVTAAVAAMVRSGEHEIPATNGLFGDPAYLHRKQLRIVYTIDGKETTKVAEENTPVVLYNDAGVGAPLACSVVQTPAGPELVAYRPGEYEASYTSAKRVRISVGSVPAPVAITGPWSISFQPGRGAPEHVSMNELESLSLSKIDGVKYFSGTAEYTTTFTLPAGTAADGHALRLSLGGVRDLAEVSLNGHDLGVWWRPPFEADVSGIAKDGANTLRVRVTNTWVNRLIGDEQLPDDCEWNGITIKQWPAWFKADSATPLKDRPQKGRLTFTTWKHWHKDSVLPESGLLGPVQVIVGERRKIQ
jgi:hypothetical protein